MLPLHFQTKPLEPRKPTAHTSFEAAAQTALTFIDASPVDAGAEVDPQ